MPPTNRESRYDMEVNPSTSKHYESEFPNEDKSWPATLQISFASGLIWSIAVIIEINIMSTYAYPWLLRSTPDPEFLLGLLESTNLLLILFVLVRFGRFELRKMVFHDIPEKRQFLLWIYLGLGLTAYQLPLHFREGLGPQPPDFVIERLSDILGGVIIAPIQEEVIYRGLFYGAIRKRFGTMRALVIGIGVFVFAHSHVHYLIANGDWHLLLQYLVILTLLSCFVVYLYESRRSLLLCMVFHGCVNLNFPLAFLIGFMFGGHLVM